MQKDFHFYVTHAAAVACGLQADTALLIAWADQYTDDNTAPAPYGVQTASGSLNWSDPQIQGSVIMPFHFVPGDNSAWPWAVTPAGSRVTALVNQAVEEGSPLQLGIALYSLQDSFSHQHFSGWREKRNACWPKDDLRSVLPNIGHAELVNGPDDLDNVWIDPRDPDKARIVNRARAYKALIATLDALGKFPGAARPAAEKAAEIRACLAVKGYEARKHTLKLAGNAPNVRYSKISPGVANRLPAFHAAAGRHLGRVMALCSTLPRLEAAA